MALFQIVVGEYLKNEVVIPKENLFVQFIYFYPKMNDSSGQHIKFIKILSC